MRVHSTIGIMTLFVLAIQPAESRDRDSREAVLVCVNPGPIGQIVPAEGVASKIFAGIGVKLQWRHVSVCPPGGLMVSLTLHTPPNFMPGALAYAKPHDGAHIRVFYDRVSDPEAFARTDVRRILGHVLAHEIGHMLEGVARHSDTGVMKATWTPADFESMAFQPLRFTDYDAVLIRGGLAHRPTSSN